MPNRIIRPGINRSRRVDTLGWAEEVFYRRLFAIADDYGIFELDFDLLKSDLYPLKHNRVSTADIGKWWRACVNAALVSEYEAQGGVYGVILNFQQQARVASIYPMPPADSGLILCKSSDSKLPLAWYQLGDSGKKYHVISDDIKENHVISDDILGEGGGEGVVDRREAEAKAHVFAGERARFELLPIVSRIKSKHPRVKEPLQTEAAIMKAIMGKIEDGQSMEEAVKAIEDATELYAKTTSEWPESEKRYIMSSRRWFEGGCYDEPVEDWKRLARPSNGGKYVPQH